VTRLSSHTLFYLNCINSSVCNPSLHLHITVLCAIAPVDCMHIYHPDVALVEERKGPFFCADTASALSGLNTGPLRNPKCDNIPFTETLRLYRDVAVTTNCTFLLQYVPAHVGLFGNTAVDLVANSQAHSYPMHYQSTRSVSLRTIKSILKQSQHQQWLSFIRQHSFFFTVVVLLEHVSSRIEIGYSTVMAFPCIFVLMLLVARRKAGGLLMCLQPGC